MLLVALTTTVPIFVLLLVTLMQSYKTLNIKKCVNICMLAWRSFAVSHKQQLTQGMALSARPNITSPILEYSIYHYNLLP